MDRRVGLRHNDVSNDVRLRTIEPDDLHVFYKH